MTPDKSTRRRFLANSAKAAAAIAALPAFLQHALADGTASTLASDPRRPQFHLLPARNWMNDPNGPIFWRGRYHMFFQSNPNAAVWGDMHWAHAVSPDMIHWQHLPIALAPTPDGPDADGCFSGTAVVQNGVVTFLYTGVQKVPANRAEAEATLRDGHNDFKETQLLATSTDPDLRTWTKRPTPVIAAPPASIKVTGFRDPTPWLEDGTWYMAIGSGEKGKGGAILLYKSADLQTWQYQHLLTSHNAPTGTPKSDVTNPVDSGDMWECPDIFPLGDKAAGKHVLIYSTQGKVFWQVGTLDKQAMTFHQQQSGLLDYGSFYAPKTQLDKAGNRILWGWIPETRPEAEFSASGWAGLMSIPRVLTLGADGRVAIAPAPALAKLRKREQKLSLTPVKAGDAASKEWISNQRLKDACGELLCIVKAQSGPFTLDLLNPATPTTAPKEAPKPATPETEKEDTAPPPTLATEASFLSIRYSKANPKELVVDQQRLPTNLAAGEPLELHFYIDGSVIELFVNHQTTFTKRFYYPGTTAPEIALSITGNPSDVTRLSLWQLSPISKDRLTT